MENNENNIVENESNSEEIELSFTDKITGVFSEPSKTFSQIAKFPIKTIDWLLPFLILMIIAGIIRSVVIYNEEIMYQAKKQQTEMFEKMVKEGKMTQEQADKAIENSEKSMEIFRGPVGWVINIISSVVFGFIFFFIISGIYFLFIKFLLKGEGSYQHVLVANGLTSVISIIQVLLVGIITLLTGKIIMDTSLANLFEFEKGSIVKFFVSKIDPLSVWAYSVLSIGLAKLNKAENSTPYFILVFSLWIVGGLLLFYLGKGFPFLSGFGG